MPNPSTIAIIDDDLRVIDFAATILEDEGYRVASWRTGAGAHAFLLEAMPAAVLLDMRMETPNAGMSVLEAIRDDPATRALPVILSTARASFPPAQAARLAILGCAFLPKPYLADDLLAAIARAADQEGAARHIS